MNIADHIRPLLRNHDCVIIPDFGGLVADSVPARVQPNRHALSPPARLVAFNQSLTRNDGLLVDALAQHLRMPAAQAREALRQAVAGLQHDLDATNRTELPGIGVFRRAAGRGLSFEYTGTDALLPAAYGLPELAARPVRAAARPVVRAPHTLPTPRLHPARPTRRRLLSYAAVGLVAGLVVSANYLFALHAGYLPTAWQARLPLGFVIRPSEPQQAGLARQTWVPVVTVAAAPAAATPVAPNPEALAAAESPAAALVPKAAARRVMNSSLAVAKAVAAAAKPAPAAKATPTFATTINAPTGRYYIVGGSFRTLAAAQVQQRTLMRLGHRSRIVLPRFAGHQIKVSIDDYADKSVAEREAQRMRTQTHLGKDLWILAN